MSLTACDFLENRDRTYDDDPKLEFAPLTANVNEEAIEEAGGDSTLTTDIQLIGRQRDSDLEVNFTIADSTTAEEGTHYTLSSTSATIEANSSSAPVEIQVLDNNADDGDTNHLLYLALQDSEGVEAAENLKVYELTIRGADE